MTGVKIEVPETAATEEWGDEFTLPSGAKAQVRPGKGRDVRMAMLSAGQPYDPWKFQFALTARRSRVGGKQMTAEGMDELSDTDALALIGKVNEADPTPAP